MPDQGHGREALPSGGIPRRPESVKVRESDASISLRLPGSLGQTAESTCQALLTGMMVYFAQLHDEYPEHIEVLEDE